MQQDLLHRYLFDKLDVRGELVQIEHAYNEMIANHNYPEPVKALLGELLVATCLLTATLKFEGEIAVQLQGDGPVKYAVINGDDKQNMRGIARMQSEVSGTTVKELVGKGYMVITITPTKGERYQGIVPLEHDTLSKCIESYFGNINGSFPVCSISEPSRLSYCQNALHFILARTKLPASQ